jgi:hypothetical protein
MSLPQRLYQVYSDLKNSVLVQTQNATDENMLAFQQLLNQATPISEKEEAQRELVRGMYYSNPVGFMRYVSLSRNRVGGLVLWTESKRMARYFNLQGRVHISWSEENKNYAVTRHVPRAQRNPSTENENENGTTDSSANQTDQTEQDPTEQTDQVERSVDETSYAHSNNSNQLNRAARRDPNRVRGVQSKRGLAYQQAMARRGGKVNGKHVGKTYKPKSESKVESKTCSDQ